jgi:hypothetical protein
MVDKTKLAILFYHHRRPPSRQKIATVGKELLHFRGEQSSQTFQDDSPDSRKVCYLYRAGERADFWRQVVTDVDPILFLEPENKKRKRPTHVEEDKRQGSETLHFPFVTEIFRTKEFGFA